MPKTLQQGFEEFIKRLAPLPTEQNKAKSHRGSVQSCMTNNFESGLMFETGSFGNGTGIRHYSDTDYFAPCPSKRFGDSSAYALQKVRDALKTTFWNTTGISVKTPAVQLPFGVYASEVLEITPCFFMGLADTPVGKRGAYWIADFNGGWMKSSPDAHNTYVRQQDLRLNGKLKHLIQLVKAWKFYNNVPVLSFYLELRTTKYAESLTSIEYDRDLRGIIRHIHEKKLAGISDPMGISGVVKASQTDGKKDEALSKLQTANIRAEHAFENRVKNVDKAFEWWDKFFNNKFPAR